MVAFSAKFSTPPSGKTMDWTQKSLTNKMMARPPLSPRKIWWKSRDARGRERMKCDVFHFFTGGSAAGSSAGIVFTHGPIFGFFAPQGRHVAPIKVEFGMEKRTVGLLLCAKLHLDRFQGGGLWPPKLKKIGILPI